MYLMQKILQAVDRTCEMQELADVCGQKSCHSQPVKITDAEHSGEQTQTMCDRRSHHSLPVEITDAKHSGEQTQITDVIKEATAHMLWRSQMQNTEVSKLRPWMGQKKLPLTGCGDHRCRTQ
jgi:hypothetical protein